MEFIFVQRQPVGSADTFMYILLGSTCCVMTLILIAGFIGFKESKILKYIKGRKSPGDIIFAIALSDFLLAIYWLANGIYYIHNDTPPLQNGSFCQTSGFIAMVGATGSYIYNCAYILILLYFKYLCSVFVKDIIRFKNKAFYVILHTISIIVTIFLPLILLLFG